MIEVENTKHVGRKILSDGLIRFVKWEKFLSDPQSLSWMIGSTRGPHISTHGALEAPLLVRKIGCSKVQKNQMPESPQPKAVVGVLIFNVLSSIPNGADTMV